MSKPLILFILLMLTACREQIIHNLMESDANRLLTKLHQSGLNPEKVKQPDGKWAVAVPNEEALQAIQLLDENRVFKNYLPNNDKNNSLVSSRSDQKFGYERNVAGAVEATLHSIRGVYEAHVHLNLPSESNLFGGSGQNLDKGSGAVLLVVGSDFNMSEEKIQTLAAGASGVTKEKISVVLSSSTAEEVSPSEIVAVASTAPETATSTPPVDNVTAWNIWRIGSLGTIAFALLVFLMISIKRRRQNLDNFKKMLAV